MENANAVEQGWRSHPRRSLFEILSKMTGLMALTLDLSLKGEAGTSLELPQLQTLGAFLSAECQPVLDFASLQSTNLTSLTLWGSSDECRTSPSVSTSR